MKTGFIRYISNQYCKNAIKTGQWKEEEVLKSLTLNKLNYVNLKKAKPDGADRARFIYKMVDGLIKWAMDADPIFAKNNPISCRKGCSACCYERVEVTVDEAELLAQTPGIDWDAVKIRASKEHEHLSRADQKCVFLKNNECSVYADRPVNCRKYFVTNDPKFCDMERFPGGKTTVFGCGPAELTSIGIRNAAGGGEMNRTMLKVRKT